MLQRVSFPVAGTEIEAILHLPEDATLGGVAVLGGRRHTIDSGTALCTAIAAAGVAAIRFAHRNDDALDRLADTAAAIRLLRAHPSIPQRIGVVGHSYGGAIAALAAGRDSRIQSAVLIVPPADRPFFGSIKPLAEGSRTRAKVLVVTASADEEVAPADGERYATVMRQAGVVCRLVRIEGADHLFTATPHRDALNSAVTDWLRDTLS
ncbi:MAG TPA: alpha/beta fold hydrolase [Candidatus Limnocylindria bacterium]|nr:alpha/beta fold hydrolase [Candidatus Limnocylindria bacterium]